MIPKASKIRMRDLKRLFPWSIDDVEKVASNYYSLGESGDEEARWKRAATQAVQYLVRRRAACRVAIGGRLAYERLKLQSKQSPWPPDELSEPNAFDKAVRYITNEKRTDRALPKLRQLLRFNQEKSGSRQSTTKWQRQLELWRKRGISREEIRELQRRFAQTWPRIKARQNRKRAFKRYTN